MNMSDFPLVLFTVLSQAAIGLVLVSTLRQFAAHGPAGQVRNEWFAAFGLLALGLFFSLFHLGEPLRAAEALKHLSTSWLSREALGTGVVLALVALGALLARTGAGNRVVGALAAAAGVAVLLFMGMTYSPPAFPALNNVLPFVFFSVTALAVGAAVSSLFTSPQREPLVRRILATTLVVGLVIHLAAPCIWLSGGTVMAATGWAWLGSPLYWAGIAAAYVVPLLTLWGAGRIPAWLPVVILAGEMMGRTVFFTETIHSAVNMGGIY